MPTQEVFRPLRSPQGCSMTQYSLKLRTYEPAIIDAFERLRGNRKQASFTREALKEFLSTEKGKQTLMLMEKKCPDVSSQVGSTGSGSVVDRAGVEQKNVGAGGSTYHNDQYNNVLTNIMR